MKKKRGVSVRRYCPIMVVVLFLLPLQVYAAPPNTATLNLSRKDVGQGWAAQVNTTRGSSAEALLEGRPVAQLVASGFRQSNEVRYRRILTGNEVTVPGLIVVGAAVEQFDTPAHARAAYLQGIEELTADKDFHALNVGAVGLQHGVFVSTMSPQHGMKQFEYDLAFYRGDYAVGLIVWSQGVNSTTELLRFARVVDGRIQRLK